MKIGFLINPVAGMGGPLGLGGSDNRTLSELSMMGATPVAASRARVALGTIKKQPCSSSITFLTCGEGMGENELQQAGMKFEVVYHPDAETSQKDTSSAVAAFLERKADVVLFVGGDGTARDVCAQVQRRVPILGVPSGVKMHSSVFLNAPGDAGRTVQAFFDFGMTAEGEVMDVDEEEFRAGRVSAKLYCSAVVPDAKGMVQPTKSLSESPTSEDEIEEIAEYVVQNIDPGALYIFSTGSTVAAVSRKLGIEKNELTVNAAFRGKELGNGLSERRLLDLVMGAEKVKLVVTPIGRQGFVFGRGNQQISPQVLREIDNDDILIIASPSKLAEIGALKVDTGDPDMDERLRGFWKVLTGYAKFRVMQVQ